ncbi:Ankyrin-2 [Dactylellina cionopaga]|nr:Ankyrin-2 [Dactylellina cionopaga]
MYVTIVYCLVHTKSRALLVLAQAPVVDIRTRLKRAILTNDLLVVKRLCTENPSCVNYCDSEEKGNTPLHIAAEAGLYSIVVFLCASGHESNGISRNYEGQTPLMVASGSTHTAADDVVFYLANEFPRSVNWRDKSGMTAILIDSEADINAFDPLGNTSLHYASAYGHLKAIRTLIDRGASFEHRNREGWYAKDYSFSKAAEQYFGALIGGVAIKNATSGMSMANIHSSPGGSGVQTAPSSRDGSKRPGTAGSFSYASTIQGASSSTSTLVPSSMSGTLPVFAPSGLGSTISFVAGSGPGTPIDDMPPTRTLKSAASMVEFSRMDRGSMSSRPGTPISSNRAPGEMSSPSAHIGTPGGRHSATGSVSSYTSIGSVGSMGLGIPVIQQGQPSQSQQSSIQGLPQRSLYDTFNKLRPRASSNS